MKYIKLWGSSISMSKSLNFRWEWRVEFEYMRWSQSQEDYDWRHGHMTFNTRRDARRFVRTVKLRDYRKLVVKRRLVQVNWEEYKDSFRWNRGCGKS